MPQLDLSELTLKVTAATVKNTCAGKVFRVRKQAYIGKRITFTTTLTELKRISCSGCEHCGWIDDDVSEGIANQGEAYIHGLENFSDGDMITLAFVEDSRDWESGAVDDWHLEAKKYIEPEKN